MKYKICYKVKITSVEFRHYVSYQVCDHVWWQVRDQICNHVGLHVWMSVRDQVFLEIKNEK